MQTPIEKKRQTITLTAPDGARVTLVRGRTYRAPDGNEHRSHGGLRFDGVRQTTSGKGYVGVTCHGCGESVPLSWPEAKGLRGRR